MKKKILPDQCKREPITEDEIKNCPFCNSDKIKKGFDAGSTHIFMFCYDCSAAGPLIFIDGTKNLDERFAEALIKWNHRGIV